MPALFLISERDLVVSPAATRRVAGRWGGDATLVTLEPGPGDDPMAHVLAGDILSPGMTDEVVARIVDWAREAVPGAQETSR